ncbi:large subunit ribosomal protein L21 [Arthrobacter agilis]|jgi:large subunit ribosomal protein L21|nr:large subunit ribosomal protein L21 [Arthrobacter agilis]
MEQPSGLLPKRTQVFSSEVRLSREVSSQVVYAIVRAGGRQEKVSVGDLVTLDRVTGQAGSTFNLPALLLVDGAKITSAAEDLAKVTVTAEIVENLRGPKIVIQKFKNKTGYKKRQGHRSELTRVKITGIA